MFISKNLIADKELEMSINVFALFMEVQWLAEAPLVIREKRVMASETGKAELHGILLRPSFHRC